MKFWILINRWKGRFSWFQFTIRSGADMASARSCCSVKGRLSLKREKGMLSSVKDQVWLCRIFHPNSLTPLKEWCKDLETENIDWVAVFNNTFISITNNYRLIQFQYKLLMRISTSRYMRFKMSIVRDNPICCNCKLHLETLAHIFLKWGSVLTPNLLSVSFVPLFF